MLCRRRRLDDDGGGGDILSLGEFLHDTISERIISLSAVVTYHTHRRRRCHYRLNIAGGCVVIINYNHLSRPGEVSRQIVAIVTFRRDKVSPEERSMHTTLPRSHRLSRLVHKYCGTLPLPRMQFQRSNCAPLNIYNIQIYSSSLFLNLRVLICSIAFR